MKPMIIATQKAAPMMVPPVLSPLPRCAAASASCIAFRSAGSALSTLTISPTPAVIPPLKSPCLKRGVIVLRMIRPESASVSVPVVP